jgi:hypothetical protein
MWARLIPTILLSLAKDDNTKTTIAGLIAAAVVASGVDFEKLFAGDPYAIAQAVSAALIAVLGFLATKRKDGSTTAVGTVAGALYASSGEVASLVTGFVMFLAGYLTNKFGKPEENPEEKPEEK